MAEHTTNHVRQHAIKIYSREKLFIHPKLMQLLSRDGNAFEPYRAP